MRSLGELFTVTGSRTPGRSSQWWVDQVSALSFNAPRNARVFLFPTGSRTNSFDVEFKQKKIRIVYFDNPAWRKQLGTFLGLSSVSTKKVYVDSPHNILLGRVGKPYGWTKKKVYVDSPRNNLLGRVGKPYGWTKKKVYVDSPHNILLGRVGKPYGWTR
jgi:hypothetical protein